ncbi:hypothetical protein BSKO_00275 [Bryopsis sp. KO-2023]|nr:hypothetical protein BSKO_00275 [Bryopsis sp. KO-2023]
MTARGDPLWELYSERERTFLQSIIFDDIDVSAKEISSAQPPKGGQTSRNRHLTNSALAQASDDTLKNTFQELLDWNFSSSDFPDAVKRPSLLLVEAILKVYTQSMHKLLPTPAKSPCVFNLRHFSRSIQGLIMMDASVLPKELEEITKMDNRLWMQEVSRVFYGRLIDNRDRRCSLEVVIHTVGKTLKNDFGGDVDELVGVVEQNLLHHNVMSNQPVTLATSLIAMEYASRICRVLTQPGGHGSLVGVRGRKSSARRDALKCGMKVFQVQDMSEQYLEDLGRHNCVPPTSASMLQSSRAGHMKLENRCLVDLEKLDSSAQQVACMQKEIQALQMQLMKPMEEVEALMAIIETEKKEMVEPKAAIVKVDEAKAVALKGQCEAELAEAVKILEEALGSLHNVEEGDISYLKKLRNPPRVVKLVLEAVCVVLEVKPARFKDQSGKMIQDYWNVAVALMHQKKFLESLRTLDKDKVPRKTMQKIRSVYIADRAFDPKNAKKACPEAEGLCKWVHALSSYDKAAKVVQTKKKALEEVRVESKGDGLRGSDGGLDGVHYEACKTIFRDRLASSEARSTLWIKSPASKLLRDDNKEQVEETNDGNSILRSVRATKVNDTKSFLELLVDSLPNQQGANEDLQQDIQEVRGDWKLELIPGQAAPEWGIYPPSGTDGVISVSMRSGNPVLLPDLARSLPASLQKSQEREACERIENGHLYQTRKELDLACQLQKAEQTISSLRTELEKAQREIQRLNEEIRANPPAENIEQESIKPYTKSTGSTAENTGIITKYEMPMEGDTMRLKKTTLKCIVLADTPLDLLSLRSLMKRVNIFHGSVPMDVHLSGSIECEACPNTKLLERADNMFGFNAKEDLSIEKKIITPTAKPLMINLQGQANKEMGTFNSQSYIIDLKLLNKNLLKTLENRFQQAIFMENVKELRISSTELNPLNPCNPDFGFPVIMDLQKPHHPPEQCVKGKLTKSPEVDVGTCATSPPHIRHALPKSSQVKSRQIWSVKTDPFGTRQSLRKSPSPLSKEITENVFSPPRGDVTHDNDGWPAWNDRDLVREYCELDCIVFEPEFTLQENVKKAALIRSLYYDLERYLGEKDLI